MLEPDARVLRVFNNNAVLVSTDGVETVLAGRGIGFGKKPGDSIPKAGVQRQFVEASEDKIEFLKSAKALDPQLVATVSEAVDIAADLIKDLSGSIYVVLVDHLVFAVQRHRDGTPIQNKLVSEIKIAFPTEYNAAEILLQYVNAKLGITLPDDEAGFIALHLNAARTGDTVKQPLSKVNELGLIVEEVEKGYGLSADGQLEELLSTIKRITNRIHAGELRSNAARLQIASALPQDMAVANSIITKIAEDELTPDQISAEAASLAVFLHGWRQSVRSSSHK